MKGPLRVRTSERQRKEETSKQTALAGIFKGYTYGIAERHLVTQQLGGRGRLLLQQKLTSAMP